MSRGRLDKPCRMYPLARFNCLSEKRRLEPAGLLAFRPQADPHAAKGVMMRSNSSGGAVACGHFQTDRGISGRSPISAAKIRLFRWQNEWRHLFLMRSHGITM